jgi:FtsZ-binding cell division protein ZapB
MYRLSGITLDKMSIEDLKEIATKIYLKQNVKNQIEKAKKEANGNIPHNKS